MAEEQKTAIQPTYIDNLIEDFGNITERKEEINSTMNNLRREYRNLWTDLWEVAIV